MCGIFLQTQLPAQVKMTRSRQFLFYGLTLLSFLGFNVSPINAQTTRRIINNTSLKQSSATFIEPQEINNDDEKKDKRKSRRKERRERKKNKRINKTDKGYI